MHANARDAAYASRWSEGMQAHERAAVGSAAPEQWLTCLRECDTMLLGWHWQMRANLRVLALPDHMQVRAGALHRWESAAACR